MYPKYIGQRIKSARLNAGLSQDELAKKLGIHRPTVSQMESGKRAVDTVELIALSRILRQPLSFFVDPGEDAAGHGEEMTILYRADEISKNDKPVVDDFIQLCKDYAEIEELAGIERDTPFPFWTRPVRSKRQAIGDGEKAAGLLRKQLDLGTSPFKELASIMENHGIKIIYRPLKSSQAWGFSVSSKDLGYCIFINSACVLSRQLFTLAHELGHIYMDHHHSVTIYSESNSPIANLTRSKLSLQEIRANVFAAAFLMPGEEIHDLLENIKFNVSKNINRHIIKYLCDYFGVSYPAMVYRLHNLDYFTAAGRDELLQNPILESFVRGETTPEQTNLPARYTTLAFEAYRSMKISIGKLADYLRTDIYDTRRMVKELGIQQTQ